MFIYLATIAVYMHSDRVSSLNEMAMKEEQASKQANRQTRTMERGFMKNNKKCHLFTRHRSSGVKFQYAMCHHHHHHPQCDI